MPNYKLSNDAKEDLIRLHQYGVIKFGMKQADKYFNSFFEKFELISINPYSHESIGHIRTGYRRCVNGSDRIYYKINNKTIEIMSIVGRQDLNNRI